MLPKLSEQISLGFFPAGPAFPASRQLMFSTESRISTPV
jgi:hypothetical protein